MLLMLLWQVEKIWVDPALGHGLNSISTLRSIKRNKNHNKAFAIVSKYSNITNSGWAFPNILVIAIKKV